MMSIGNVVVWRKVIFLAVTIVLNLYKVQITLLTAFFLFDVNLDPIKNV